MTIPARTKRAGKWWHNSDVTVSREHDSRRRKIRLAIGEDLRIELTVTHAVELINDIADLIESRDD